MKEPLPLGIPPHRDDTETLFSYYRGGKDWFARERPADYHGAVRKVRDDLAEVINARHLAFLLGAGCSSHRVGDQEVGIPTMVPLAREFLPAKPDGFKEPPAPGDEKAGADPTVSKAEYEYLLSLGIDVTKPEYRTNLERLIEVAHAHALVVERAGTARSDELQCIRDIIRKVEAFILHKCIEGPFSGTNRQVHELYRRFYRKLIYRDRQLPRPWIFTTNYDLFSEQALDSLGIAFCNGFAGLVERVFNPSVFRYALAEQFDVSSRRWTAVDNYLYLCKLHGSISWRSEPTGGLHKIREIQKPSLADEGQVMIFPTPLKHYSTIASPYTDLFREFQAKIVNEQTVLITVGYSFGDEHINAIIYQALTVPTFRLVVFAAASAESTDGIQRLINLDDPRIWVIYGKAPDGRSVHYFEHVVDEFLPELPTADIEGSIRKIVDLIQEGANSKNRRRDGDDR